MSPTPCSKRVAPRPGLLGTPPNRLHPSLEFLSSLVLSVVTPPHLDISSSSSFKYFFSALLRPTALYVARVNSRTEPFPLALRLMDHAPKILGPDAKPEPFSFSNGALKRHQARHHWPPPLPVDFLYRECLKNHAASLGGHALDGCGEFMPSPAANPANPTSLKCAACGCHRNFHRRLPEPLLLHHPDVGGRQEGEEEMDGSVDQDNDGPDEEEDVGRSSASPPRYSFAPHMLLALSSSLPAAPPQGWPAVVLPKKRFRTKFSPEQKERMQELSERLGWRMQKRDDGLVEEWCREIGVGKGVFKVWMHNNKHTFLGLAKRGEAGGGKGS